MFPARFPASLVVLLLLWLGPAAAETDFAYLKAENGALITAHRLTYRVEATDGFTRAGPKHRTATFNTVPYKISLGAFIRADGAVMVHAERVADGSGASNYTRYPETDWPDGRFRIAPPKCLAITPEDIEGEHDLEFLRDHGFTPLGNIYLVQYFATTDDFNDEVVLSFLARVPSCGDKAANAKAFEELRDQITVTRIE